MKMHEWMVKPTAQREWIDRRGILLWLAFFFIELGAGTFFIGSFFGSLWAMLVGWIVCGILGGGTHILYLGHPVRFWRMILRPQTSWISRGLAFVSLFLVLGGIHMLLLEFAGVSSPVLEAAADIFAFMTVIYGGFAMNYINGIPLWNSALLPVLFAVSGIWGGAGVGVGIALVTGSVSTLAVSLEEWVRVLLIAYVVLLFVYLASVRYTSLTGKVSVRKIISGRYWPLMWFVVVVLGLVLPIGTVVASYVNGIEKIPLAMLYLSILCELAGDLSMRYLILKQGMYAPLIPSSGAAGA